MSECAYVDGVVFRKSVVHKKMVRPLRNPRVLLLAGGVEFQRSNSRMASFDTLLEQERHYIQILVEKIAALRPDLVLVGQGVSRQAQEYLEQHEVVVIQHVKAKLMKRIARAVGATILSSTDHVQLAAANGAASSTLGHCALFRTVAFPSPTLEERTKVQQQHGTKVQQRSKVQAASRRRRRLLAANQTKGASSSSPGAAAQDSSNADVSGDNSDDGGDDSGDSSDDKFDEIMGFGGGNSSSSSSSDEGGRDENKEEEEEEEEDDARLMFRKVPHMKRERGHG